MQRVFVSLTALLLAGVALAADKTQQAADAADKPVVVDPLDLRQPVPNPEAGLTEKYDGKSVRFTGQLQGSGQDAKTKAAWYNLQVEVPKVATKAKTDAKAKKAAKEAKDVVTVKVYFQKPDQRLRASATRPSLTVVGKGEITTDGSLIIRNAEVVNLDKPPQR